MSDNTYLLKVQLAQKPGRGFSSAKQERILVDLIRVVAVEHQDFMDTYYNCETDKEGVVTITLKSTVSTDKYALDDLVELRYRVKRGIEKAIGAGYGEVEQEELNIPMSVLWTLGVETRPDGLNRQDRNTMGKETKPVSSRVFREAMRKKGVYEVDYIMDLEKQDKED